VDASSLVGKHIVIRGEVNGEGDLRVEGRIEGSVSLPANRLEVAAGAEIDADICGKDVEVRGKVAGDVYASHAIVVRRVGELEGNLHAPRVALDNGCKFRGNIDTYEDRAAAPEGEASSTQTLLLVR
jgi:cytoskeletal protein CcmA (bactofilin family)